MRRAVLWPRANLLLPRPRRRDDDRPSPSPPHHLRRPDRGRAAVWRPEAHCVADGLRPRMVQQAVSRGTLT